MTRKGLAFGAMVALSATSFVALPAAADTTGPVTLVPTAGTTFNSILQSGITLKSEIDPDIDADEAGALSFYIENASARALTLDFQNATGSLNEFLAVAQADPFSTTAATGMNDAARLDGAASPVSTLSTSQKHILLTGSANISSRTFAEFVSGVVEVQSVASVGTANGAYVLDLPGEAAVTYTASSAADLGVIASGLDALVSTADITADGTSLVITYKNPGDVALATLSAVSVSKTVSQVTQGSDATNYNFGTTSAATVLTIGTG